MSCYTPIQAYRTSSGISFVELRREDILGDIEIPCGMCIGCRMRRASDWTLRVMHEASQHESNCFVTLTYAPGNLPAEGSLEHRDYQLFMKRLRKLKGNVRFYMCGEYGEETERPHYHACLFGVDFRDRRPGGRSGSGMDFYLSEELDNLWKLGRTTVQDLVKETASYCARYIMKKQLGKDAATARNWTDDDGVIHERKAEYAAMSLKPGIGAEWFNKYARDVFPHDRVINNGMEHQTPKYYDKLAKRTEIDTDLVEYKRQVRAKLSAKDNTPERRKVRELVHNAKVKTLTRGNI